MRADTLHVTLAFLGLVKSSRLEALHLAASEVRAGHFELILDEARFWEHNHIIHAAPSVVPEALQKLVLKLQSSLEGHGFDFDRREYRPHATLLRNARACDLPKMQPVRLHAKDFALVSSTQEYRVLARYPLV